MINFVLVIQKSFNLRHLKFHQDMNKRTHFNYRRMAMLLVMLATILTASAQKARQEFKENTFGKQLLCLSWTETSSTDQGPEGIRTLLYQSLRKTRK